MIIAVSGTPGTGKTAVAKALSRRLGWELVELNSVAEKDGLYAGEDKERGCKIVDIGHIRKAVREMAASRKNLVLDAHYSHDMDCDVVVMLRTDPAELKRRLHERGGWKMKKIEENVQSEIMEICKQEALDMGLKVIEVDTTGRTADDVATEVISSLGSEL